MTPTVSRRECFHNLAAAVGAATLTGTVPANAPATQPANATRKMRLGLVTYNIAAGWDLPTVIEHCRELGLAAVELRTTHRHGVEPSLSKSQRADVRKRFTDAGLVLWGLGTICEFHAPDPAAVRQNIETAKQFIELAEDVGAKGVKVRPNGLPPDVPEEKTIEQIGRALHECGSAAADRGVELWLEVHGRDTSHPPRIRRVMDIAALPNVGVTWNSNHPTDLIDGSVETYFQLLKDKILSVHINELVSSYPWAELFKLLNAAGYDRYTMIEIQPLNSRNPEDSLRFLRYYRDLWDHLSATRPTPS